MPSAEGGDSIGGDTDEVNDDEGQRQGEAAALGHRRKREVRRPELAPLPASGRGYHSVRPARETLIRKHTKIHVKPTT